MSNISCDKYFEADVELFDESKPTSENPLKFVKCKVNVTDNQISLHNSSKNIDLNISFFKKYDFGCVQVYRAKLIDLNLCVRVYCIYEKNKEYFLNPFIHS